MNDVVKKAHVLIASVRAAVINDVRHYSDAGHTKLIANPKDIVALMCYRGKIYVDEQDRVERTTVEAEYFKLTGEELDIDQVELSKENSV